MAGDAEQSKLARRVLKPISGNQLGHYSEHQKEIYAFRWMGGLLKVITVRQVAEGEEYW